jgi:hypothetical protein
MNLVSDNLCLIVLNGWITLADILHLDSAICNSVFRADFLRILTNDYADIMIHSLTSSCVDWMVSRKIKVKRLFLKCDNNPGSFGYVLPCSRFSFKSVNENNVGNFVEVFSHSECVVIQNGVHYSSSSGYNEETFIQILAEKFRFKPTSIVKISENLFCSLRDNFLIHLVWLHLRDITLNDVHVDRLISVCYNLEMIDIDIDSNVANISQLIEQNVGLKMIRLDFDGSEVGSSGEIFATMIGCEKLQKIYLSGSFDFNFDLIIKIILSKAELSIEIYGGTGNEDIQFEFHRDGIYSNEVLLHARDVHFKCSDLDNFFTQVKGFVSIEWEMESGVSNEMAFAIADGNPDLTKIEVNHRLPGNFTVSESLVQIFKHCSKLTSLHYEQDDYTDFDKLIAFFSSPFVKIDYMFLRTYGVENDLDANDEDEDDNLVYSDILISILKVNSHIRELTFENFGYYDMMRVADKARVADYILKSNRDIDFDYLDKN